MLSTMFGKVALQTSELPVVKKSHDDLFLSKAIQEIGERPCANGERCLARFIAQVRYGPETDKAFVCKEFLLPEQYENFKAGKGLPTRRAKCLLCARYFTVRLSTAFANQQTTTDRGGCTVCLRAELCLHHGTQPSPHSPSPNLCPLAFRDIAPLPTGPHRSQLQGRPLRARHASLL